MSSQNSLSQAIGYAIKRADIDKQRARTKEEEQIADALDGEISEQVGLTKPSDSALEIMLDSMGELGPVEKQYFLDAVIAGEYGIKLKDPKEEPVMPYSKIGMQIGKLEKIASCFSGMISYYLKEMPKLPKKPLNTLADACLIGKEEVGIYQVAMERIDKALNKLSLQNDRHRQLTKVTKISGIVGGGINLGALISSYYTGSPAPAAVTGFCSLMGGFLMASIIIDSIEGNDNSVEYKMALAKHAAKKANTLSRDLATAIKYGSRLLEQLNNPQQVNERYLGKNEKLMKSLTYVNEYMLPAVNHLKRLQELSAEK